MPQRGPYPSGGAGGGGGSKLLYYSGGEVLNGMGTIKNAGNSLASIDPVNKLDLSDYLSGRERELHFRIWGRIGRTRRSSAAYIQAIAHLEDKRQSAQMYTNFIPGTSWEFRTLHDEGDDATGEVLVGVMETDTSPYIGLLYNKTDQTLRWYGWTEASYGWSSYYRRTYLSSLNLNLNIAELYIFGS